MKKKKSTNKKRAFISIFLIAALLITGAFAFLTSTDSKTNVFAIGNVKIELIEEFDGETYNGGVDPKTEGKVVEDIVPGQIIEKAPYVKNVGENDAYVYISVGIPVDDAQNVYTKNGTYTSKNELSIPVKAYAIQENYKNKTGVQEVWNAYFDESVYDIIDDDSKVELFELLHKDESTEYVNGINSSEWVEVATYKTADYNYYVYGYTAEDSEMLLANKQTTNLFDAVKFNSGIGGRNPNDSSLMLNYLTTNSVGKYEVIKSIEKEEGEEINELYSPNALAKTGYSLDWHINSPDGEIATAAYKMNDDTDLYGVYTNLIDADSDEEYDGAQYLTYALGYNEEFGGLYAIAIGADSTHADYPDEPTMVAVPANINITLTESGVVTSPNGTIKGFTNNSVFDPSEFNNDYADVDTEYLNFKSTASAGMYLADSKANGLTLSYTDSTLNGQMNVGTAYEIPVKMVTQAWADMYTEDEETDLLYSEYVALHNITKKLVLPDLVHNVSFGCPWFVEPVLTEVEIPMSCTIIDADAFADQTLLTKINLGYNIREINTGAFAGCENLTSIVIPDSVKIIGNSVFDGCIALKSIDFGDGLEEIEDGVFCGCKQLANVTLPDSLKTIGENAFESCSGLTEITIPKEIKTIKEDAFDTYTDTTVKYLGTMKDWDAFLTSSEQREFSNIMPIGTIIQCTDGTVIYS